MSEKRVPACGTPLSQGTVSPTIPRISANPIHEVPGENAKVGSLIEIPFGFTRGLGTSAASRPRKSNGSNTTCVVALRQVMEQRTPGSVRGAPSNRRRSYRDPSSPHSDPVAWAFQKLFASACRSGVGVARPR
jgi:hypothetical protein